MHVAREIYRIVCKELSISKKNESITMCQVPLKLWVTSILEPEWAVVTDKLCST